MGDSALNEIDDLRLNKLVEDLIAQGLSKSTICVIFGILSRALNHAVKSKAFEKQSLFNYFAS